MNASTINLLAGCAVAGLLVTASLAAPAVPVAAPIKAVPFRPSHLRAYPYGPYANKQAGLGKVLTTSDGGQIFGFDIDQNGDDGVLASAVVGGSDVSVETFDQDSGKIAKTFATKNGTRNSYSVDGIAAGDVALVTHYVTPKGSIYAKRLYEQMNPVTGNKFTGPWTSPVKDINIEEQAENQSTSTSVAFAIELQKQDDPILVVTDIAKNTVSKTIDLDPNFFSLGNGPQLGQYTAANEAIIAESPDYGAVGGEPPINYTFDLKTGKSKQFNGYNNGDFHAGSVNGGAVDPNTGILATDTELNSQVEFYDMNKQEGIAFTQLPCTSNTDQTNSGSGIAVDAVNGLFLVTETYNACGSGSALVVFDEAGNVVETITGFNFAIGEPPPVLNPSKRMGWAFSGPKGVSQLQQFFY